MTQWEFINSELEKYKKECEKRGVKFNNVAKRKLRKILHSEWIQIKLKERCGERTPTLTDYFHAYYSDSVSSMYGSNNPLLNMVK